VNAESAQQVFGVKDMAGFRAWLAIDLAVRPDTHTAPQNHLMVGVFVTWVNPPKRMRASDFSLRVALMVHSYHITGKPILYAAEAVAKYDFVKGRLGRGRRGKRSTFGPGTEVDETVRTTYYKFRSRYSKAELDGLLELWYESYLSWCAFMIDASEDVIDMIGRAYISQSQPDLAKAFRDLVDKVRREPPAGLSVYRSIGAPLPNGKYQTVDIASVTGNVITFNVGDTLQFRIVGGIRFLVRLPD
jgi:hypothetical protein